MQKMQLCFIALWSLSLSSTSAFVMNEASFSFMHHRSKELSRKHNGNETKRATVFALDLSRNKNYYGDYINYSAEDNDSYNDHETIDIYELAQEKISSNKDYTEKLARLAVLFAPPGQQIMLANLDYVDVVHIDDKHLELAVGVCEEYCITVLVPIQFAHSCSADGDDHVDDLEECVIDNVEILLLSDDNDVNDKPPTEHLNNDNFDFCSVQNPCSFPQWWVHADGLLDRGMYEDCSLLRDLLNEDDFQSDLIGLAKHELNSQSLPELNEDEFHALIVKKASVLAIGPAGVYIRARIGTNNDVFQDNFDDDKIFDLPVSFSENKRRVIDVEALRASILDIFESS